TSQVTMKTLVFVSLVGLFLHDTTAGEFRFIEDDLMERGKCQMHSLKNFYTASSEVPNFPEFVIVGMVDDFQITYYDSNTKRTEPKQDWAKKVTEDKADYWEWETESSVGYQQNFKVDFDTLKRRFNQTGGLLPPLGSPATLQVSTPTEP
uniref:MHC class I-like antigen recognition-like domain-containing protein n=1 Tax=Labrus bergylta TaxID=56723 RepID=A0A3Q3FHH4_9LABR